jgi:hypothetical protein
MGERTGLWNCLQKLEGSFEKQLWPLHADEAPMSWFLSCKHIGGGFSKLLMRRACPRGREGITQQCRVWSSFSMHVTQGDLVENCWRNNFIVLRVAPNNGLESFFPSKLSELKVIPCLIN